MIAHVISAENQRSYEVVWIEITTTAGNLVLLESHAPFIATLVQDKPVFMLLTSGKHELIHLQKQAVFELLNNVITIIL
jgi:F0F1-type ATP synthase epsilon subunit